MKVPLIVCMGFLSIGVLAAPIAGKAEPTIEQFRFDPPQLCLRDMFRWSFSYRGFPGGLEAMKEVELLRVLLEGRPVRSPLTPTRDDLQRYTADQGRFESHRLHWPQARGQPLHPIYPPPHFLVKEPGQTSKKLTQLENIGERSPEWGSHKLLSCMTLKSPRLGCF